MNNPSLSTPRPAGYPSPSTATVTDLLTILSGPLAKPMSVRELAAAVGASRTTAHRILETLCAKGFASFSAGQGYTIGESAFGIGSLLNGRGLHRAAAPFLRALHAETRETVNLAIRHHDAMLVIAGLESSLPLRTTSWVGKYDALHASALGKAYLAALPPDALEEVLARLVLTPVGPRSITDADVLQRELVRARRRGFAVDDEESVEGMRCVGAAIAGPGPAPAGAISVSAPSARLPRELFDSVATAVVQAAQSIAASLALHLP